MTSIPHFEDMSVKDILDSLDLKWMASEKLDGSYLQIGLDDAGQFYTQRKGGQPIYDIEDWPDELWSATYRRGHAVASCVIEALVTENAISPGNWLGVELLEGVQPNSIPYKGEMTSTYDSMVVTHTSWSPSTAFYCILGNDFSVKTTALITRMIGATEAAQIDELANWMVRINNSLSMEWIRERLSTSADQVKLVLNHWLPEPSNIRGFSKREILETNLSRKHPNAGDRNWNELRKEIVQERARLRPVFDSCVLLFKEAAYRVVVNEIDSIMGSGCYKEGAVVATPRGLFKLVDREAFSAINEFTHRVKYAIVGGRRPARSCFLSRTKDWPKEKRLARLEKLLTGYRAMRYSLHYNGMLNGRAIQLSYSGDLHRRTLGMFYDTKKRIEDGR